MPIMNKLLSAYIQLAFAATTLLLIYAAAGYAFSNVPIRYVSALGTLWIVNIFILGMLEESC